MYSRNHNKKRNFHAPKSAGFTLIELLIAITIIGVTIIGSISMYTRLQVSAQLNEQTTRVIGALRTAQTRALEGIGGASHGVYANINQAGADSIVIYQGPSYAARVQDADLIENFPESIFLSLQLSTTTPEILFARSTGIPNATGTVIIELSNIGSRTVGINKLGISEEVEL